MPFGRSSIRTGSARRINGWAAKGLEAPVVFIAEREGRPPQRASIVWDPDEAAVFKLAEGERPAVVTELQRAFAEEEQREYERLLYVAMTRARDRLVVASWQKRPAKVPGRWWASLVRSALVDNAELDVTVDPTFPCVDRAATPAYVFEENRPGTSQESEPARSESQPAEPVFAYWDFPHEAPPPRAASVARLRSREIAI